MSGYTYSSRQRRSQHHYNYIHQNISLCVFAYLYAFLFMCSPLVFTVSQTFFESSNVSLANYSVANDVTPEMTDEINCNTGGANK